MLALLNLTENVITHPCEFVNSLFETGRQEKAISNSRTFCNMNMSSLMSLVPVKKPQALKIFTINCCILVRQHAIFGIWWLKVKTVLLVTRLSAASSFMA